MNPFMLLVALEYALVVNEGRKMGMPPFLIEYTAACACINLIIKMMYAGIE